MKTIASFTINHDLLDAGMYTSRVDGDVVTYDVRMKKPNAGEYLEDSGLHTFEHLFATFARNSEYSDSVVYVGPMGCRTGFYLLLAGDYSSKDIVSLVIEMYEFIRDFKGEVPGASPKDCGNYLDMNLSMANYLGKKYLDEVLYGIDESRLVYPE
mgnify:CR=1 FL=1